MKIGYKTICEHCWQHWSPFCYHSILAKQSHKLNGLYSAATKTCMCKYLKKVHPVKKNFTRKVDGIFKYLLEIFFFFFETEVRREWGYTS